MTARVPGSRTVAAVVGLGLVAAVAAAAADEHRWGAVLIGLGVLGGHLVVSSWVRHAGDLAGRTGVVMWMVVVASVLAAAPSVSGVGTPTWLFALPVVSASVGTTARAVAIAAIGVGLAAGAGLFIAGAAAEAGIAAVVIGGAGLFAAVMRRQVAPQADPSHEAEFAAVRAELRDLRSQHVPGAEGRLVALTRANQALQGEVERGRRILEEALDASRTKTSFLLKISHELRTPLNAIVGYTELLLEQPAAVEPTELEGDLGKILGAAHELLALIDSVLDLARLEAGKFELQIEEFALADLVHEAVSAMTPQAERGHNRLKLKLSREVGAIKSDRTRLRQVLVQLLGNACKFTHDGLIELRVEPLVLPTGMVYMLSVSDTGVGIASAYLPRLFLPFSQADDSPRRRFGGLGVGLALCKHYCTLLGGEIAVESELGKGTVFRVQVPATARDPRETGVLVSAF